MLVPDIFIAKWSKPYGSSIKPDPQNAQCMTKRFPHGVQGWSDSQFFIYFFSFGFGRPHGLHPSGLRQTAVLLRFDAEQWLRAINLVD